MIAETAFTPAELDQGFVVAIEIVAKAGEEDAVAGALQALVKPTMAEPGVKLFLPYRSPTNSAAFFIFELYENEAGWAKYQKDDTLQVVRRCHAATHRAAQASPLRAVRPSRLRQT